ncbi:MAG: GTP-binding protein [Thermoplasmata archaeon]|nr:GTP-binding protein [Thermoplasmata archaeon]
MSSLISSDNDTRAAAKRMKAKVCLVGEQAVGKTSLVRRFVLDAFDDSYIATMGAKVLKRDIEVSDETYGNLLVNLVIWDIMGNKSFRDLFKEAFFQGAQGLIAVCDVTRKATLGELENWIKAVSKVAGDIPVQILANKVDLVDDTEVAEEDIKEFSDRMDSTYVMTSAKTGKNVEDSFDIVARKIIDKRVKASDTGLV